MAKKIYRSTTDRKISGLCGGLAEYWDYDSTIIRITLLALMLISNGLLIWLYFIAAFLIPERGKKSMADKITNQSFEKTVDEMTDMAQNAPKTKHGAWIGVGLIALGTVLVIRPFLPSWLHLDQLFFAAILIGGGILIIKKRKGEK